MADNKTIERKDKDLYFNGVLLSFAGGEQLLERELISYESRQPDVYHTVQQGDTLTFIAWKYYKSFSSDASQYWKYIADANNIENPLDLSGLLGKEILIPNYNLARLAE